MENFIKLFKQALYQQFSVIPPPEYPFGLALTDIFNLVKKTPYREKSIETIQDWKLTLQAGGDCGDYSFIFAAWALVQNYPFYLVFGSNSDSEKLHVWVLIDINGAEINIDATNKNMEVGQFINFQNIEFVSLEENE